jgi:hypothetical protein
MTTTKRPQPPRQPTRQRPTTPRPQQLQQPRRVFVARAGGGRPRNYEDRVKPKITLPTVPFDPWK